MSQGNILQGEGSACVKKWLGDKGEDSLTSL
jgi:hypothetical protein